MMSTESYNELYSVGDYLVLDLFSGDVFEGDYCNGSENRIDLINTTQHNNPNRFGGTYSFYRSEICKITVLKSKLENIPGTVVVLDEVVDHNRIKISEDEYNRLKDMYKNYMYIEHVDDLYYSAIEKLRKAESIGVAAVDLVEDRTEALRLLAISTWEEIYIFDLFNFKRGYLHPDLTDIFESHNVCKVIHNSGLLKNILSKKYKVYMNNVFDTFVVDLVIEKNRSTTSEKLNHSRNISECLVHYLKFPHSVLLKAINIKSKEWLARPLSDSRKQYAAELTTYMILLRDTMQQIMFSEVFGATEHFNKHFSKLSPYEFFVQTGDEVSEDVKKLVPSLKKNTVKIGDNL